MGMKTQKSERHGLWNQRNRDVLYMETFSFLGTIEISTTQLNHAGRYTCIARNAAGSAHRHVTLRVQGMKGYLLIKSLLLFIIIIIIIWFGFVRHVYS